MKWSLHYLALSLLGLAAGASLVSAQEKGIAPAGGAVSITVSTATPPPPVSITLHERHGHVNPIKGKCAHTGGGLIDVSSPSADTVIITMSGAVLANASMQFDVDQCFEVSFDDPKVKKAKLTVEGRVIGVLRGEPKGCAEYSEANASVEAGPISLVGVSVPAHQVCGKCESLAVNDHDGPKTIPVMPGKYTLHQTFTISAQSKCILLKKPSAEFAPDPALDPLWISYFDPFHGVSKKDFGFQVTVKVAPDTDEPKPEKKTIEQAPKGSKP
jgi:hypothetical protein